MEKDFRRQRSMCSVLYFQLIDFRRVYEYYDENFITWYAASQEDCRVRIFCMNPANQIQARIAHGISRHLLQCDAVPLALLCRTAGRKGKGEAHRPALDLWQDQCALIIHKAISTRWPHRAPAPCRS